MTFGGEHGKFLAERIKRGEVVLVLGAGANWGSLDRFGKPMKDGRAFAKSLTTSLGFNYQDEPLPEVVSAYLSKMGSAPYENALQQSFQRTQPAGSIRKLLKFTWKRLYTWNIDDSLAVAATRSPQRVKTFNGMSDKVEDDGGLDVLQLIYLHGMVDHPSHGFIFSEQEYSSALQRGGHSWYQKLADDYRAYTPVFVGSSMNEPVLAAEIERARRQRGGDTGLAFLIIPDELSEIRLAALKQRGIHHIRGGVEDFAAFVEQQIGPGWTPASALSLTTPFDEATLSHITRSELATAQFLKPIDVTGSRSRFAAMSPTSQGIKARNFLRGFPPSWEVASSRVPISLHAAAGLKQAILDAAADPRPMLAVVGAAGSGKTTAVMSALAEIASEGALDVYEAASEVDSIPDLISILGKISDKPKIVYLPILYIMSGILTDHMHMARSRSITFVTTARSSEWASHLEAAFQGQHLKYELSRFDSNDYDQLIDRLVRYVPAPKFVQLSVDDKKGRLRKASGQLLIALREVTESKTFDEIIVDEFDRIESPVARRIFIIVGFATLARVGVRPEVILQALGPEVDNELFDHAMRSLEGIAYHNLSGRIFIRHEFYVRKVFETGITANQLMDEYVALASTYLKYRMPIMRNVNRPDGILFRYLFNHDFVAQISEIHGEKRDGLRVFQEFEVPFQLDGHYWLQYALFVSDLGDSEGALSLLVKSIEAFPGNLYAKHALAVMQLRSAADRPIYDGVTKRWIDSAVGSLREMIASSTQKADSFPLVTLALRHTGTLIRHKKNDEAVAVGKDYLAELQRAERTSPAAPISATKECILRYLTLGSWEPPALFRDGLD